MELLNALPAPLKSVLPDLIAAALEEDLNGGDRTTEAIVPPERTGRATLISRAPGILAGVTIAAAVFRHLDAQMEIHLHVSEGASVAAGSTIATFQGNARALLSGERVALNFLQHLSGIATLTHQFVQAVADTGAIILDTRKTMPGLRALEKWAVQVGGGQNHRMGLYDMVLIKENHIALAGSITNAVTAVRHTYGSRYPIEVEVRTLEELEEAISLNVDRILLDNMEVPQLREAVKRTAGRIPLEASGRVTLNTVRAIAETGVDYISVGQLTHSAPALDISMLIDV